MIENISRGLTARGQAHTLVLASRSESITEYGVWCGTGVTINGTLKYRTSTGIRGQAGVMVKLVDNVPTLFDADRDVPVQGRILTVGPHAGKPFTHVTLTPVPAAHTVEAATISAVQRHVISVIAKKMLAVIHDFDSAMYEPHGVRQNGEAYTLHRVRIYKLLGYPSAKALGLKYGKVAAILGNIYFEVAPKDVTDIITGGDPAVYIHACRCVLFPRTGDRVDSVDPTILEHELTHAVTYNLGDNDGYDLGRYRGQELFDSKKERDNPDRFQRYFTSPDEIDARIQEMDLAFRKTLDSYGERIRDTQKMLQERLAPTARRVLMKRYRTVREQSTSILGSFAGFRALLPEMPWEPNIRGMIEAIQVVEKKPAATRTSYERNALIHWERGIRDLFHTLARTYGPLVGATQRGNS